MIYKVNSIFDYNMSYFHLNTLKVHILRIFNSNYL